MKKYALSLQGGGLKGTYYLGAIQAMVKHGIEPDMVLGSSTGAVFGAFIAMREYGLMEDLCRMTGETNGANIFKNDILKLQNGSVGLDVGIAKDRFVGKVDFWDKIKLAAKSGREKLKNRIFSSVMNNESLMSNDPLFEILEKYVKIEKFKADFWVAFVSLKTGQLHTVRHDQFKDDHNLNLGILASSNIPILLKPVARIELKDGTIVEEAVDGGLRMSSPISLAFQLINKSFEWEIISLYLSAIDMQINSKKKTTIVSAEVSADITMNDGVQKDTRMSNKINQWALESPDWALKNNIVYAKLHSIPVPVDENGLNVLGSVMDARPEWINKRIMIGFNVLDKYFSSVVV